MKLLLLIGILVLSACAITGNVLDEQYTIGVLSPASGDAAVWGVPVREGVELAVRNRDVQVVFEDTKCDPKIGVNAAQKLINVDEVDAIVGAVCSSVTLAVAPIAQEAGVVLISPSSTNPQISDAGEYVFRTIPSDSLRGRMFAQYVIQEYKKVDYLYINNAGGVGNMKSFFDEFEERKGQISAFAYEQGQREFQSELLKVANSNSKAVVIASYPKDSVQLVEQIRELGLEKPLYMQTEAMDDPNVQENLGLLLDGITYIMPRIAEDEHADKFKSDFTTHFEHEPGVFAAESYDAANLLMEYVLCEGCGVELLAAVKEYDGASGKITFDSNGDVVKPFSILRFNGTKVKEIKVIQ